jgi:hypothetical protein
VSGQQPRQRGQHDPVGGFELGALYLSAKYRDLMAQDQDFDVLGAVIAGECLPSAGPGTRSCVPTAIAVRVDASR